MSACRRAGGKVDTCMLTEKGIEAGAPRGERNAMRRGWEVTAATIGCEVKGTSVVNCQPLCGGDSSGDCNRGEVAANLDVVGRLDVIDPTCMTGFAPEA